jgi:hypothetical protein
VTPTATPTPTVTPTPFPGSDGDVNDNGYVNAVDLELLVGWFYGGSGAVYTDIDGSGSSDAGDLARELELLAPLL